MTHRICSQRDMFEILISDLSTLISHWLLTSGLSERLFRVWNLPWFPVAPTVTVITVAAASEPEIQEIHERVPNSVSFCQVMLFR